MRSELTIGSVLGLVLGGVVTFALAQPPSVAAPPAADLEPLHLSDSGLADDGEVGSTDGGHRPVRPGSQRLHDFGAARS